MNLAPNVVAIEDTFLILACKVRHKFISCASLSVLSLIVQHLVPVPLTGSSSEMSLIVHVSGMIGPTKSFRIGAIHAVA